MNKIIVVRQQAKTPEPKDCPICKLAFSDKKDVLNYRIHGCCQACDVKYRYPNREKWEEGWRPDNYIEKGDP